MSPDLQTQIRDLAQQVELSQDPVTVDEIRMLVHGREGTEPFVLPRSPVSRVVRAHGPWPAVVAAIVVLLLFGALAWMLPSGEPVPPADSFPHPSQTEQGYYTTSAVPDGFVLQDIRPIGESHLLYLREFDDTWIPTDAGFSITGIFGRPAFLPEDPDAYIAETHTAVPGSSIVEVDGRPGVIYQTQFTQGDLTAPLVWVLATDDQGGVFEIAAVGMSREEVLAVAGGVHRIPVEEFVGFGSQITWDVRIDTVQNGFAYSPPSRVTDLATQVDVALGLDLLSSRLAHAGGEGTVITTDEGEIVETFGLAIRASAADLYLEVEPEEVESVLSAYPGSADLSPERRDARIDRYVDQIRDGEVVSEDPYVIQAPAGLEPSFDVDSLGEELPMVPAASVDVVPDMLFESGFGDRARATHDRPVVVIGTVEQPGSNAPPVTLLVWFTELGVPCTSTTAGDGMGSACGFELMSRFGVSGESSSGIFNDLDYAVPLETSVVQIVTGSQSYWQQPVAGYGIVAFGDTVDRPTALIAYDAAGNEIGEWQVPSNP